MKVKINRIKLFGYHGVYEQEKTNGQEFHISVEIKISSKYLDDITSTVDYSLIIQSIKETFDEKRYDLIESLAIAISDKIMKDRRIKSTIISVKKPTPPIDVDIDSVEVVYKGKR